MTLLTYINKFVLLQMQFADRCHNWCGCSTARLLFRPQLLQILILMHHDSSEEEVNRNVTETSVVSDNIKATIATFDEEVSLPAWRATEDHTL